jgi:hypothetical protein
MARTPELGRARRLREVGPLLHERKAGRGFDDGIVAAAAVLAMLDSNYR